MARAAARGGAGRARSRAGRAAAAPPPRRCGSYRSPVVLHQPVRIEPQHLGVAAQERLDEGGPGEHPELLVLERAQVLGPDLGLGLDVRDVEALSHSGFAQRVPDGRHLRRSQYRCTPSGPGDWCRKVASWSLRRRNGIRSDALTWRVARTRRRAAERISALNPGGKRRVPREDGARLAARVRRAGHRGGRFHGVEVGDLSVTPLLTKTLSADVSSNTRATAVVGLCEQARTSHIEPPNVQRNWVSNGMPSVATNRTRAVRAAETAAVERFGVNAHEA